jgi:hypothetical protein
MATKTLWTVKDALLARVLSSNADLGAGQDHHLGVGRISTTHLLRSVLQIESPDWSGLGITQVTSAVLRMKVNTGSNCHASRGGTPRFYIRRVTESWSAGTWGGQNNGDTGSETWNYSNAVVYPGPSTTTSGQIDADNSACSPDLGGTSDGTVVDIDITTLFNAWVPSDRLGSTGAAGGGSTNYGMAFVSYDTGDTARYIEFDSGESAYEPRIILTYSTNTKPSTSLTTATNQLAKLTMDSSWSTPRLVVAHTYSDPLSQPQASYRYRLYADSAGSMGSEVHNSGEVTGVAPGQFNIAWNLTNGAYYWLRVEVKNINGVWSDLSTAIRVRARWAVGAYYLNTGVTPTGWTFTYEVGGTGANASVYVEYSSSANTTPGAYVSSPGAAALAQYFHYRVWLFAWGASGVASPTFNKAVLTFQTGTTTLDAWTMATAGVSIDTTEYQYGSQCLKIVGSAAAHRYAHTPLIPVKANTDYRISARIRFTGAAAGSWVRLLILDAAGTWLQSVELTDGNQNEWMTLAGPVWNSGSVQQVRVYAWMNGATGTTVWYDSVQLEASKVVTPWRPSLVGSGVAIDSAGVQIKGGATFRLMGSAGGVQDIVELGPRGLTNQMLILRSVANPSGNTETGQVGLWHDSNTDILKLRNSAGSDYYLLASGSTFPSDQGVGDRFYRTDRRLEYFWDGTRWLSQTTYVSQMQLDANPPYTATAAAVLRGRLAHGGFDLYITAVEWSFYVGGGGSALSGSHKWTCALTTDPGGATLNTGLIDSGSSSVWREVRYQPNTVQANSVFRAVVGVTKTGSPGDLYLHCDVHYRLVG